MTAHFMARSVWMQKHLQRIAVTRSGDIIAITRENLRSLPLSKIYSVNSQTGAAHKVATLWLVKPTAVAWCEASGWCAVTYNGLWWRGTTSAGGLLCARITPHLGLVLNQKFMAHLIVGWLGILGVLAESIIASLIATGTMRRRTRLLIQTIQQRAAEKLTARTFGSAWAWPTFVQLEPNNANPAEPAVLLTTATGIYKGTTGRTSAQFEEVQGGLMNCVHLSRDRTPDAPWIVCEGYLHYPGLVINGKGLGAIWRRTYNPDKCTWSWALVRGFLSAPSAAVEMFVANKTMLFFICTDAQGVAQAWCLQDGSDSPTLIQGLNQPGQIESLSDSSLAFFDQDGIKTLNLSTESA